MKAALSVLRRLGRGLARILEGGLVFLIGCGLISAYLPPTLFWWTGIPATFLPYLIGLLFPIVLIHGIYRRWIRAGAYGLLFILFIAQIGIPLPESSPHEPSSPDHLRVLSFNLTPQDHTSRTDTRAQLHDIVSGTAAHVAAIQGSPAVYFRTPPRPSWPIDTLLISDYMFTDDLKPGGYSETHQSVFTRRDAPRLRYHRKELISHGSDDNPSRRSSYRPFVRSELTWEGTPISVYNVHLRSIERERAYELLRERRFFRAAVELITSYRENALQRAEEAASLAELIDDDPRPTVLVGDFNATPFHWEYRTLSRQLSNTAPGSGIFSPTWHTRLPFVRIDHILVSSDWAVESTGTISSLLSDHRPIFADLTLTDAS